MRRSILASSIFAPFVLAAAVAACTSDDNAPATSSNDSGSPNDSTVGDDIDSSPGQTDAASPIDSPNDTAPATDAGDGGLTFLCVSWDAAVELDAATYANDDAQALQLLADGGMAALPGFYPTLCSIDGDAHAPMTITNNGPCPIDYWWVDYNCAEEYYGTIQPGQQGLSDTFVTHPWRLRATGSEILLKDIGPAETPDAWTAAYP